MTTTSTAVPRLTATLLNAAVGEGGETPRADSPLLVLGPSLGTSVLSLWAPALPWLAEDFTLIGWDLPGHGRSAPSEKGFTIAELARAVVDVVGEVSAEHSLSSAAPRYAAGVSIGGATTLQLGLGLPGTFDRLAVICSAAVLGTPEGWQERAELVSRAGTPTMVSGSASRWFAPGFIEARPEITTALLRSLQNADRHSYAHACRALAGYDLRESLDRIGAPVLAIAGAEDGVCPPADAEAIAEGVQDGRARILPGVAHLAPAEAPEATAALLKEFFHA